jgi:SHOCT-like protein
MATDPLERVLQLVAEGRLTAEEAGPILAALDERGPALSAGDANRPGGTTSADAAPLEPPRPPASSIRLEVREGGRSVVNLRLPLAVGKLALDRIPGLSREQVDRVREALSNGVHGPILVVDDGDDVVRIVVE